MTRDLLRDLDTQPSAPETDELREKFRIVKVLQSDPLAAAHAASLSQNITQLTCCTRIAAMYALTGSAAHPHAQQPAASASFVDPKTSAW